jgi:hypothetical protein
MILIRQVEKQERSLICCLKVTNLLKTNNFVLPVNTSCFGLGAYEGFK